MARSRRGPRTRLDASERRALSALKKAGVYKPKGTPSPANLHRKLRKPGMAEVAAGRATAVKVGTKAARAHRTVPHARDRVVLAKRPMHKVYARQGRVYEVETDLRGRTVPGGGKRRIPLEPYRPGAPRERPLRGAGRQGWVVTVNGYPSTVFFTSHEQAESYARRFYQRPTRATRLDPEALVVSIDPMTRNQWDEIMDEREQRQLDRRRRDRERKRALRRSIRPFR